MTISNTESKWGDSTQADLIWRLDDEIPSYDEGQEVLQKMGYEALLTRSSNFKEDYGKYAPNARGVILAVSFPIGTEDIKGLTSCKIIAVAGGGYNHVDLDTATKQGRDNAYCEKRLHEAG